MKNIHLILAAAALSILWCGELSAQTPCENDPNQELSNCSFEIGDPPAQWNLASGDSIARSTDARNGAAAVEIALTGPGILLLESDCFPITSTSISADYGIGAYIKIVSGALAPVEPIAVRLTQFTDAGCTVKTRGGATTASADSSSWSLGYLMDNSSTFPDPGFAKIDFQFIGSDLVVRIDDSFAGPNMVGVAPPPTPVEIPTLGSAGLIALILSLVTAGLVLSRRTLGSNKSTAHGRVR